MSMTEKEKAEIVEKGNKVVDVLMKTLKENMDCNEANTVLLEFVVAKFAALNVLDVQEMTNRTDIEDEVFAMMRMLMEILGKDMRVQSLKNKKNDIEKLIEEKEREKEYWKKEKEYWKKEYECLKEENEKKRKEIEEKMKIKDKLEKEREELLKKIANSKKDLN